MAGAGYKLFATGDVLTAAQVNTYLMQQTVMVFASSAARTTALSGVLAEGMLSYLQDTDKVEVYNGSAWVDFTGDITGVTAGTGLSGGGTSGSVTLSIDTAVTADLTTAQTLTNKKLSDSTTSIVDVTDATKAVKFDVAGTTGVTGTIATAFTTAKTVTLPDATDTLVGKATTDTLTNKTISASSNTLTGVINNTLTSTTGDIIYASSANTPARLGIGTSGQVLTVSGGLPTWASASGSASKLVQVVTATYSTETTISSTSYTDSGLSASITPTSSSNKILVMIHQPFEASRSSNAFKMYGQIVRGSTAVLNNPEFARFGAWPQSNINTFAASGNGTWVYVDSPATTSSTTYKTQYKVNGDGGDSITLQILSATAQIILMEVTP